MSQQQGQQGQQQGQQQTAPQSLPQDHFDRYTVEHETRYAYTAPVSQSWQLGRLTPRGLPWQRVLSHSLQIDPPPDERHEALDSFGNSVSHFGLHGAHRQLRVRMQCQVEVGERPAADLAPALTVDAVREALRRPGGEACDLDAARMAEPTRLVPLSEAARLYAEPSLQPDRPWIEALSELTHRIHADFEFDAGATTVSTSVDEVMQHRRGVCQDFAHLMLACLRGHGLSARYMSGYLLTDSPPGMPRLMGVDASHAWVAAYLPDHGWVEFDPTNNQLADRRYITLAWGADFADVVPLRGVILGGGTMQRMDVSVSVIPQG
ncbi:MAG: transglutaminase family protein [Burkholderiaceae bacterium]|nr:transglutaminase family protein [Burkholderiaceae bacterium]